MVYKAVTNRSYMWNANSVIISISVFETRTFQFDILKRMGVYMVLRCCFTSICTGYDSIVVL